MTITLARLLSAGFFPVHAVLGNSWMLRSPVGSVVVAPNLAALASVESLALVVFPAAQLLGDEDRADVVIRMAAQRNIAGLVLGGLESALPERTRTRAEASGVALVLVDHDRPEGLASAMDRFLRGQLPAHHNVTPHPTVPVEEDVLGVVAHRLRTAGGGLEEMLRTLGTTLRCRVGLVIAGGRVLAGDLDEEALTGQLGRLANGRPGLWPQPTQDGVLMTQPVQLTADMPVNLWLVAGVTEMRAARVRTVGQALVIATWALVAHLAGVSLELARRDRDHHVVLSRLLDEADRPSLPILEQATALGWQLTGWHTAVRITTRGVGAALPRASVGVVLHRHLAANDIRAVPLSGDDDWTMWTSGSTPPHDEDAVRADVRRALLAAERELPGIRLCAGVGAAGEGLTGLRASMTQAREASLLASTRDTPCAVERLGRDSVNRILVAHHAEGPQHQLALHLLRPLTDADPSGQLVHTLACYLDHESSATAAAGSIGVHRNTVLQRLDRIRVLLDADLSDVDQRLALHLAARLVRMGERESAELGSVG